MEEKIYPDSLPALSQSTPSEKNLSQIEKKFKQAEDYQKQNNLKQAIKIYTEIAEDYALAQNNLGVCLQAIGDYKAAFTCYEKALKQGCTLAQVNLSGCYADGIGVEQDTKKAMTLCRQAAELGCPVAQFNYAHYLMNGEGGLKKNPEQAINWYKMSAKQGYMLAQYNLGCYLMQSTNTAEQEKAIFWLRQAGENGCEDALYNLGRYYDRDDDEKNVRPAIYWYKKAMACSEGRKDRKEIYENAVYNLAYLTEIQKKFPKSEYRSIKIVRIEEINASDLYKQAYQSELDGKTDLAIKLYKKIADKNVRAMYQLATLYDKQGNEILAIQCYKEACKFEFPPAQYALGLKNGESSDLIRKAAEQDHMESQLYLAEWHEKKIETTKKKVKILILNRLLNGIDVQLSKEILKLNMAWVYYAKSRVF